MEEPGNYMDDAEEEDAEENDGIVMMREVG